MCNFNIPGVFDFGILCIDPTRPDSLYRYDIENNRIYPTFTFKHVATDPIPWHGYNEWPDHFTGQYSGPLSFNSLNPEQLRRQEKWFTI